MRLCAVVPSYRHYKALPDLLETLRARCERIFLVDDGNEDPARTAIAALHAPDHGVVVIRLQVNSGKGAAVVAGLQAAIGQGFTHALQIDADGQHELRDVDRFLTACAQNPSALICGKAVYDGSVPKARKIGRYVTHVWVWIETMSLDISDSMCGFRIYPLKALAPVLASARIGRRMDFDTEIAVRMHWRGVPVVNVPTRVVYPSGNVSNFRMLQDNVLISWMHTRLAVQAPFRLVLKAFRGVKV